MRSISIVFILFLFSVTASAQSTIIQKLQRQVPGEGKVTVHQDESITSLIGKHAALHAKVAGHTKSADNNDDDDFVGTAANTSRHKGIAKETVSSTGEIILGDVETEVPHKIVKAAGYRVQVYAGNNTRNAKLAALRVASDVRNFFPETPVYTFFYPPRWLCRVGDYRSMEEAYSMMRKLKATRVFHEVSIVKDRVNVSL